MIDLTLAGSRPFATALNLAEGKLTEETFLSREVVLTGDEYSLSTHNGQWCFLHSLRLLLRVTGRLQVLLPPNQIQLGQRVRQICDVADFRRVSSISVGTHPDVAETVWAVLCIGTATSFDGRWTFIASNGWVSRVSSAEGLRNSTMGQPNPIAALLAASLGVAEMFKRLVCIPADKAPLLSQVEFSLFDLSTESRSIGPPLPPHVDLPPTLQVGAGAIGNGVALLMADLNARGRWHVVDKQDYADENLGTCVLMESDAWAGAGKADRLARWLCENTKLIATGEQAFIRDALGGSAVKDLRPKLVLNGLDDVGARHDAQLAWPDILIDGGINEVGAAVVQHRQDERRLACLRCSFVLAPTAPAMSQEELTGLSPGVLAQPEVVIDDSHIAAAPLERKAWLRARKGKTVCSVQSEATLAALGVPSHEGFRPSVPFVATAAAALMVAEMVKAICAPERPYFQRFEMGSLFLGPVQSAGVNAPASNECLCVRAKAAISAWRRAQA